MARVPTEPANTLAEDGQDAMIKSTKNAKAPSEKGVRPSPLSAAEEEASSRAMRIRSIQSSHRRAIEEVTNQVHWLRQQCDDAERHLDTAHTPGNITATAGRLDAAREKAHVLRQTLEVLGAYVEPEGKSR
jgi:hypothetical protein